MLYERRIYEQTDKFLVVTAVYILAAALGILVFVLLKPFFNNDILLTFIADVCATLVVWLFGIIFKNSSIYDPYWSVQPIVIISAWLVLRGQPLRLGDVLMLICVGFGR